MQNTMYCAPKNRFGYTLVEVLLVVIILGILSTIAMRSLKGVNDVSRTERTKKTLDQLAYAIAGDPTVLSGGTRASYGYVGDVGAMPPNLDALVQNPGSYSTWKGPYVRDQFTTDGTNTAFKQDGWGQTIQYSAGVTLTSSGSGSNLTRKIADAVSDLTANTVTAVISDLERTPPGTTYKDSVRCILSFPNGSGSIATRIKYPDRGGLVQFDSIPVGRQDIQVVYLPTSDTLHQRVTVEPSRGAYVELSLYRKVW